MPRALLPKILAVALLARPAQGSPFDAPEEPTLPWLQGDLGDTAQTCDVDAVHSANIHQMHPILEDLVNTTFFRLFRVALKNPTCPYWKSPEKDESVDGTGSCSGPVAPPSLPSFMTGKTDPFAKPVVKVACDVDSEDGSEGGGTSLFGGFGDGFSKAPELNRTDGSDYYEGTIDRSMTVEEKVAQMARKAEEDDPTYFVDISSVNESDDEEDVNLVKNPERNTGYNGSHIWEAMYNENCFEVGSALPRGRFGETDAMCYEERVLYRLLSGWHASTTISISKYFYAPGTKGRKVWSPDPVRFMESLGRNPERLKNLHFSFVVMLRALKKAAPFLMRYTFLIGDAMESARTSSLMKRLLDSHVLSVCSPLFDAFDETRLFSSITTPTQRSQVKRQFKSVFRNITALVDCVQCSKCRLHAKLFSLGLGTALKMLLTPEDMIESTTSRDEIVALINVLWKLSDTIEDARMLTRMYWKQHATVADSPAGGGTGTSSSTLSVKIDGATFEQKAREQVLEEEKQQPQSAQELSSASSSSGNSGATASYGGAAVDAGFAASFAAGPKVVAESMAKTPVLNAMQADERRGLIDLAIGAVRRAATGRLATPDEELGALRSLVARPASEELLILAKHYATDRPDMFAKVAAAADAALTSGDAAVTTVPARSATATPTVAQLTPDAVIIGGGLAGMVAALSILDRGGRVTLVDKQPFLGGNSGKASSGINAAIETSIESLIADTTKSAGSLARSELISQLAHDSPVAVSWLRDRTGVDLSLRSQLGGHTAKRTLRPANAFVGAEVTFAIGQLLNKIATDESDRLRLLFRHRWTGLAHKGGKWHVQVAINGTETSLEAPAVVIACGGFGHDMKENESLMRQYRPDLESFPTTLGPQTTGDGIKIARDIGARLVDMDRVQIHPTGFVDPKKPQENTKTLAAELLRGVGGLLLDRLGSRITDELGTRQAVVNAELKSAETSGDSSRVFWLVLNNKASLVADRHTTLYTKKGLLTRVAGLTGLAAYTNISAEQLRSTFAEYNNAATVGMDRFGRTVFPAHLPIEWDEDFVVGRVVPVVHYTMGGVAIDVDGRVLADTDGKPISGLYAIGEASGGVHGDNRLAGNSLLECTVFGRRVGLALPLASSTSGATLEPVERSPTAAQGGASSTSGSPQDRDVAQGPKESSISLEELKKHGKDAERKWVALYGKIYDLTEYVEEHPGGPEAVTDVAGADGTDHFETVHNQDLLESMGFEPVGNLKAEA